MEASCARPRHVRIANGGAGGELVSGLLRKWVCLAEVVVEVPSRVVWRIETADYRVGAAMGVAADVLEEGDGNAPLQPGPGELVKPMVGTLGSVTALRRFIQKMTSRAMMGSPLDQLQCLSVTVAIVFPLEKTGGLATLRDRFKTGSPLCPYH